MKLDDLIDLLTKIKKERGGTLDVMLLDKEYSEYYTIGGIKDVNQKYFIFPKDCRRDKSIEIY